MVPLSGFVLAISDPLNLCSTLGVCSGECFTLSVLNRLQYYFLIFQRLEWNEGSVQEYQCKLNISCLFKYFIVSSVVSFLSGWDLYVGYNKNYYKFTCLKNYALEC